MQHLYWVIEKVLAGRPGPEKFQWDAVELNAAGVGGIVSLCGPIETRPLRLANITHLPLYQPMILLNSEEQRERFVQCIDEVLAFIETIRATGQATLVHCYHGQDRTGCVLACCLVVMENLSPDEAIDRIRTLNPLAMSAFGYEEAVHTFARLTMR